jgi:arylsulfatase A-like enzyme
MYVRKSLVTVLAMVIVAVVLGVMLRWPGRAKGPRYVFLICLDAVRPDHLGCYGYARDTSPRIDDLAERGILCEDAVSQAPWTVPSVATILSSRFPCQHGARATEGTRVIYSGVGNSFVKILSEEGFKTSLFTGGMLLDAKIPASELTMSALEWFKDNLDQRCLIIIHHYDTHIPYVAPPECTDRLNPGYSGPYKYRFGNLEMLRQARVGRLADVLDLNHADIAQIKALYDCQIMRGDESIGMLVDSLAAWSRLEDAMIIIFADHGEEFLEHGSIDHGQTVHEESIRVPLVVFCPSIIDRPARLGRQCGLIDIAPTILDVLGIEMPPEFEGVSLLEQKPLWQGENPLRPCGLPATCLVAEAIARRSERKALRRPPWKLIFDPFSGETELYNIEADPFEASNLADTEPQIAAALLDTLLIMERYYPGGWCVAWRVEDAGVISGKVRLDSKIIEAVGHGIVPEIDAEADSLVISEDWQQVRFRSVSSAGWEGLEIRMASGASAVFEIEIEGAERTEATVGNRTSPSDLPLELEPSQARVSRRDLRSLYAGAGTGLLIYWLEPGRDPAAKQPRQEELRRQLKAIGYLE